MRGQLYYGWYIAGAGAASNFLILGVAIFGFGVFIEPMRAELGWSLSAISIGLSLRSFENGLLAPLTGFMVDRVGPRRMALAGVVMLVLGLLLFSQAHSLWVFYAATATMAVGQSVGSFTPFSAAIMRWFSRKRGRAMGLLNSGNGAGYFVVPLLAALINAIGWRETLILSAIVILVLAIPLAFVLRDSPEAQGLRPDGDPIVLDAAGEEVATSGGGNTVAEAVRTPAFYLLALAVGSAGAIQIPWIIYQVPHLQNVGFSLQTAAVIGGVYGAVQIGLRFTVGWIGDIVGRRRLLIASFLLQGAGLLIFANLTADRVWLLPVYYLTFGVGHASWLIMQMAVIADYFGTLRFATLRGLASTLQMPLGVLTPFLAGWSFDRTGSYHLIFTVYAFVAASGAIWMLMVRRAPWTPEARTAVRAMPRA
ncbi:MAG: MFS transporter [Chloroflexi bacterium]|nr:MFS transporter [Chloroflexota bacterium]MDA1002740.1 MFS transporter [Chloroflexota bacterium]